jgi:hypothetical protein
MEFHAEMKHLEVIISTHERWFKLILCSNYLIRPRTGDDLGIHQTLDVDVDCLVPGKDVATIVVCILPVTDGDKLPVAIAPPTVVVPLIRSILVRVPRVGGLELVRGLVLDVDEVSEARL